MHRPDPYQDPPAYRWRQCGLATSRDIVTKAVVPEAWEYVVTVRPVVEDDASKPWTLSADLYAVDVALRHEAEGSFADTMSMRDLLDFLESDQGVSLTVREALALLRVGTRAANHPGALDRAEAWAPSRVAIERAAGNRTNEGVQNIHTALTVEVRALADDSLLTFTMPTQKVGALEAHPEGSARQKSVLRSKLLADATRAGARFGAATAAREAETLDAARRCAEAARAAVAALEQHFGGAGSSSGRNADAHATTGPGPAAKKSLAGGTPPRAAPPANVRKLKRDAADAAARVEALVAAAARRAAAEEMGADEDPMFTGVGLAHEEHMRATTDHAYKPYGEASGGEKREDVCGKADARNAADADKRRRVCGVGLRLKAQLDMDAGK
jgi:ribosomal protein L40E